MTVAIIAELNPPHAGHAHLIEEVRRVYGADTTVLVLLSGNYVQRGDLALVDKYIRAAGALAIGADLVLELPFPYSYSTAQIYARASVSLLNALGGCDILAFGSELGDLATLNEIDAYLASDAYADAIRSAREQNGLMSHIQLRTELIRAKLSHEAALASSLPNNILAIEYLLALKQTHSSMQPFTVKRYGSYHAETNFGDGFPSATALRNAVFAKNFSEIDRYCSADFALLLKNALQDGAAPAEINRLSAVFLTKLTWRDRARDFSECFDIDPSLSHRMRAALPSVATLGELFTALKAKNLTDAHIRRAVLNAYFDVTPEEIHTPPSYSRLLAMNERGRTCFKRLRTQSIFPILVRPTDKSLLKEETVKAAVERADFADALYLQSLPTPQSAANLYKKAPLVMK